MKKQTVLATGTAAVLLLASCGGDNGNGEGAGGDGEVEVSEELNVAYNAQPPTLDPLNTTAHATRIFTRLIFEPLVDLDQEGEVQPVLAESFEVSEDGHTLTFTLREGLTFHDGAEVTEEDVISSLERWVEMSIIGSTYFTDVDIESPEDGVVTMELPSPMYVAPYLLADPGQMPHIMPAEVLEGAEASGIEEYVGTGPYEYGEWQTDQHLRIDRYADYAPPEGEPSGMTGEKTAYYEQMYFHFIEDGSTRLAGLQTGEYDLSVPIPWDNIEQMESDANVDVISGESGLLFALFNKAEGPMADEDIRRAAIAALDTEAVMFSAYGADEWFGNNTAMMDEESQWYVEVDAEDEDFYQNQDLDAAEELLEEAGYDGEPVRMIVSPDYADHYDAAVVYQQQLEDAGFNTELITSDWATVLDTMDDPEGYEMAFSAISNWPVVPSTMYFLNPNTQGWTDSEELLAANQALTSAEEEEGALAAMDELQEAYLDYLPIIKFGDRRTASGLNVELEGYEYITGQGEVFHHIRPAE